MTTQEHPPSISTPSTPSTPSAPAASSAENKDSESSRGQSRSSKPIPEMILAVVSIVIGLSALWGIYESLSGPTRILGLLGFESVTLVACVFGVLTGFGRFHGARSLAAFNIALTIFVATTLGRFNAIATHAQTTLSEGQIVSKLLHDPMLELRFAAAALIGVLAVVMAFGPARTSWKKLGIGIGLGIPVLAAFVWLAGPGKTWLLAGDTAGSSMLRMVVGVIGGVLLTILTASSIEEIVDSFAVRLPALPTPTRTPARKKARPKPIKKA